MDVSVEGASPPPVSPPGPAAGGPPLSTADARWLALLPLGVALVFGVLLLPRAVVPEGVPLPVADTRALARTAEGDAAAAERALRQPLPAAVRSLGSALRTFHTLEAAQAEAAVLGSSRQAVDAQFAEAAREGDDALLGLRAVQLEGFLEEVRRFEATGVESPELGALAGGFVRSMKSQDWCEGRALAAGPAVLRVMFKLMWNGFLGLDGRPSFAPTLDEQRALFAFYLGHPHPGSRARDQVEAMRRGARDARDCEAADSAERRAIERWRLERIARLAAIDPTYPAAYARGVASYGAGSYEASAEAFRDWLHDHPDGPLTLRAQAFLRAAARAARID
jgi:hypothetical protein